MSLFLTWRRALGFILCYLVSWTGATASNGDEGKCSDSSSGTCPNLDGSKNGDLSSSNSCRLYMAPTTIGGVEGNYGMFTAVDLPAGATVLANDGPNIPGIVDSRKLPSKIFPDVDHYGLFDNVWWGINSRISEHLRSEFAIEDSWLASLVDLQINFGALPNCHPYAPNIKISQATNGIEYDDLTYISGDHFNNPLRGSFSYYTGKHVTVDSYVAAGTELFLDYSGDWEQHGFPRPQDYYSAAALLRKWILAVGVKNHKDKINGRPYTEPSTVLPIDDLLIGVKSMLKLIAIESPGSLLDDFDHEYDEIVAGIYHLEQLTSRVLSVVPQTTDEWNKIYHHSWELYYDRKRKITPQPGNITMDLPSVTDVGDAMYEITKPAAKSIQELRETGICLDHIVAGRSLTKLELGNAPELLNEGGNNSETMTLGRGAIAARFLAKGELIVPVPLLHLLDRSLFESVEEQHMSFNELMLNYCFGHSESTLIMCPVTNAVLVNHCSDRNGRFPCGSDGKGPNAEYRWASESEWDRKTKDTLTMTIDELAGTNHKEQHRMLSMEIVALRDIKEGEEIFIDYGEKWEKAWLDHVQNWSKIDVGTEQWWTSKLTQFELNHGEKFKTEEESKEGKNTTFYGDLRSDDVALSQDERFMAKCWYQDKFELDKGLGFRHAWNTNEKDEKSSTNSDDSGDDEQGVSSISWKELSDDEIFKEYSIDVGKNRSVLFTHYEESTKEWTGHFWPCSILSKHDGGNDNEDEDRFTVRIFPSDFYDYYYGEESSESFAVNVLLVNYPKSSIRFVTVPYLGDQFNPKAFRHHIEIKDDLFPEQWKNKKK